MLSGFVELALQAIEYMDAGDPVSSNPGDMEERIVALWFRNGGSHGSIFVNTAVV